MRRRRAESALKRAIESSQVVTAARPSKRPACCHASKNTSLSRSSATVANEAKQPAVDRGSVPGEQDLHGKLVARRDALNQDLVGGILTCRGCNRRRCGGGRSRPNKRLKCVFP